MLKREPREWTTQLVRLVVTLVVLSALINVWSAVTPSLPGRLEMLRGAFSFEVRAFSRLVAALSGFALLLLARGLAKRKRAAWWVTLAVLSLSIAAHLVKGLDYEEATLAALVVGLLLATRKRFVARADLPSVRQGLGVLAAAFVFTLLYGTLGFFALDREFGARFGLLASLRESVQMFLFTAPPLPETRLARWFLDSVYLVAASSFAAALVALLRPVVLRHESSEDNWRKATRIVETYGNSGLARFAILGDKRFYFGDSGDSLVSFKQVGDIGLALGDPIGPVEEVAETIRGFQTFCFEQGWKPVFYQTLPDYLGHYQHAGFVTLPIGQEAVVDLHTFTLQGAQGKSLRNVTNRLTKAGYKAQLYEPPQSPERLRALREVSDAWLELKHGSEKDFSLGAFEDDYIGACPVMTLEDAGGRIVAFANLVTEYQKNDLTLDLMRHTEDAPDDAMLFLFVQMFLHAQKGGYDGFNLGLVALAGLSGSPDAPPAERALHLIYERFNQFYNFKGLYGFKSKFHPRWEPRYLVYPSAGDVVAALGAVSLADSSVGFWGEVRAELGRRLAQGKEGQDEARASHD